jgi:heme exporter protein A
MIKVERIKKSFGLRRVLENVTFSVDRGTVYTLFGPNGSGKTTMIHLLSTLMKPNEGTITYNGESIAVLDASYRKRIGLLTHESFLYDNLTGYENLHFYGRIYGVRRIEKRIEELAKMFTLEGRMDEPIRNFSRGMKQRISIIRSLIHDPDVLLLDEPYTGLDEIGAQRLETQLSLMVKEGRIVIITTHNILRGYQVAMKLGILSRGEIVYESPKEEVDVNTVLKKYKGIIGNETI